MGTKAGLTVEEYLHTSFPDLDKEYRDGELEERTLPTYLHGLTQGAFFAFFFALRKSLSLFPTVETRMKMRPGRFLIPDVAVFPSEPPDGIPESPPLVVIEVLSPDDRLAAVLTKLEEYRAWGVPHVWLADPVSRKLYVCEAGLHEVASLAIPELGIKVRPADIFE